MGRRSLSHVATMFLVSLSMLVVPAVGGLASVPSHPLLSEVTPPNPSPGDHFGDTLEASEELLVVARPAGDEDESVDVYAQDSEGYSHEDTLAPSSDDAVSGFGEALALGEDLVVVGAPGTEIADEPTGVVFVYEKDDGSWKQTAMIEGPSHREEPMFGASVDVDQERIAISAPGTSPQETYQAGSVHLFEKTEGTWTETAVLVAESPGWNDQLGTELAFHDDHLAAGTGPNDQRVHVFSHQSGGWGQDTVLSPEGLTYDAGFGSSLALDGDRLLVGAPDQTQPPGDQNEWAIAEPAHCYDRFFVSADYEGDGDGAAYLFSLQGGTWNLTSVLSAGDQTRKGGFGASVDLAGERALVGAPRDDIGVREVTVQLHYWEKRERVYIDGGSDPLVDESFTYGVDREQSIYDQRTDTGASYLFRLDVQRASVSVVEPSDAEPGDQFGHAVALAGESALASAPYHDVEDVEAGAVFHQEVGPSLPETGPLSSVGYQEPGASDLGPSSAGPSCSGPPPTHQIGVSVR